LRRLAANVVDPAAPLLFSPIPGKILAHSAIVWIDRSYRGWRRCGWRQGWRDGTRGWRRLRRRRGGRRRGRRRREWRGWDCRRCLGQSCGRATPANSHAAVVLLRLGPTPLDEGITTPSHPSHSSHPYRNETSLAIVRRRRRRPRQKPEQKWNQQQQAQKATARDYASEVSPRPNHVEITAKADVLVGGFLNVLPLPGADI